MIEIEIRSDGADFTDICVNGQTVISLCKDEHDQETGVAVARAIAIELGMQIKTDNAYEWNPDTERLEKP